MSYNIVGIDSVTPNTILHRMLNHFLSNSVALKPCCGDAPLFRSLWELDFLLNFIRFPTLCILIRIKIVYESYLITRK
jgi:hypothetical protein